MKFINPDDKILLHNLKTLIDSKGLFEPFESWLSDTYQEELNKLIIVDEKSIVQQQGRVQMVLDILQNIKQIKDLNI